MFGETKLLDQLFAELREERARNLALVETITRMQREGFTVVPPGAQPEAVSLDPLVLDALADIPAEARPTAMRWALANRTADPGDLARDIREGR